MYPHYNASIQIPHKNNLKPHTRAHKHTHVREWSKFYCINMPCDMDLDVFFIVFISACLYRIVFSHKHTLTWNSNNSITLNVHDVFVWLTPWSLLENSSNHAFTRAHTSKYWNAFLFNFVSYRITQLGFVSVRLVAWTSFASFFSSALNVCTVS